MPDYLVRFVQIHESFRIPELRALATLQRVELEVLKYSEYSPFALVRLPSTVDPKALISRSILIWSIHELWGHGSDYASLHAGIRSTAAGLIPRYKTSSFRFLFDCYQGSRSNAFQRQAIESLAWLGFEGPVVMRGAQEVFTVFEEYPFTAETPPQPLPTATIKSGREMAERASQAARSEISTSEAEPTSIYLGRLVGTGSRDIISTYSLKKRQYLSTTSMDAELALIMANLALARPATLFYDPFVGTGSLTVACTHFGSFVWGSDIDGRSIRGKDGVGLKTNFHQYGLQGKDLGGFASDLVNSPIRGWAGRGPAPASAAAVKGEFLDGIVCDPPYGVREGLWVLGARRESGKGIRYSSDGTAMHLDPSYVPPRKPYSFLALLDDILSFAASTLVPDGRLSFWMPSANDEDEMLEIPLHRKLELVSVCVQPFNKWSRRLLTYRKRHPASCPQSPLLAPVGGATDRIPPNEAVKPAAAVGRTADDLNSFRKRYFQGFKTPAKLEEPQARENASASTGPHTGTGREPGARGSVARDEGRDLQREL